MSRASSARRATLGALVLALTAAFGGCGDQPREEPALETTQAPVLCLDKDCEDGDPCTVDVCVTVLCVHTPIDLCCDEDADCTGGALCTLPKCLLGVCVLEPILGCNEGSGGSSGDGGSSGSGGSSGDGGSSGSGGSSGDGGSTAGTAGAAGSLGVGGEGGDTNEGGADGDQGGESNGGSAGEGGGAGAEGGSSGTGGTASTGSGGEADGGSNTNGGSGGSTSTGGDGSGASSAGSTVDKSDDSEWNVRGGSCTVSRPSPTVPGAPFALSLLALLALVRRRSQKRARSARPVKGARLALGASALLLFASSRARADGANSDRYTAPAAPEDLLWSERASPPVESLRPFVRVSASFADDPLVLENENTSREVALIDEQFGFHFSVGAALGGRVVAALLLPVYVQSTSSIAGFAKPDEGGIGNPGLDARFAVLNRENPVELALAATLRVPIGNSDTLAADDSFSVWPRALLTVPFSPRTYLNLGLGPLLRGSEDVGDLELGSELRSVGGVHVGLTDVFGLTAEATATTLFDDFFGSRKTPIEAMGGARFESGSWVAGAGAGAGLNSGYGSPDFRALASLAFQAFPVKPPPQAAPKGPIDADHDGIADARDRCAKEPEDFDRHEDDDGCPDLDNDHDELADANDKCPDEAEDVDGFQDDDGCPDPDNDADELADVQDRCPDQPEDFDHYQDDDGCPEGDNDQDGLADARDQCPNEAETKNGADDEDGCPDLLRVEAGQIRTLEPIFFEYNRGKIQRRSEPLLIEMAQLILARPDLGVISIEGHTDSQGSDKYNLKLSQTRADAVRAFLVGAGVPEARLTAAGFGEGRPIFDNESAGGRAKNRRVEFRFDPLDPEKSGGVATTKDPAP